MQTKLESLLEVGFKTVVGFLISMAANYYVLPSWGYEVTLQDSFEITVFFTILSMGVSFCIRRIFNKKSIRKVEELILQNDTRIK